MQTTTESIAAPSVPASDLVQFTSRAFDFTLDFPAGWKAEATYPNESPSEDPSTDFGFTMTPVARPNLDRVSGLFLLPDPSVNPWLLSASVSASRCPELSPGDLETRMRESISARGETFEGFALERVGQHPAWELRWRAGDRRSVLRVFWYHGIRYGFQLSGSDDRTAPVHAQWMRLLGSVVIG